MDAPTVELAAAPGRAPTPARPAAAGHAHPGPVKYVIVAIVLAIITAIEVGLYYMGLPAGLLVACLLFTAFVKFSMVAAFFMHLRFDNKVLKRLFVTGIILAGCVYTVALTTLGLRF